MENEETTTVQTKAPFKTRAKAFVKKWWPWIAVGTVATVATGVAAYSKGQDKGVSDALEYLEDDSVAIENNPDGSFTVYETEPTSPTIEEED